MLMSNLFEMTKSQRDIRATLFVDMFIAVQLRGCLETLNINAQCLNRLL